jgi:ABC-type transporter Mla MlaB component
VSAATTAETVILDGELTVMVAAEQKASLLARLDAAVEGLDLDLAGITELDTAGVQVLLLMRREADAAGKSLDLVRPGGVVIEILALAGFGPDLRAAAPELDAAVTR